MTRFFFACFVSICFTVSGCGEPALSTDDSVGTDAPSGGPDLTALRRAYEHPDGSLSPDIAENIWSYASRAAEPLAQLGLQWQLQQSLALLASAAEPRVDDPMAVSPVQTGGQPVELDGEGTATVTRICSGWHTPASPNPDNGVLRLHVSFTDEGVDPLLWGEALGCRYLFAEQTVALYAEPGSAALQVLFPGAVVELRTEDYVLVAVDVSVEVESVSARLVSDFRITPSGDRFEIRVPVPDGTIVATFAGLQLLGIRTRDGYIEPPTDG